jgi:hypothetical protein
MKKGVLRVSMIEGRLEGNSRLQKFYTYVVIVGNTDIHFETAPSNA